MLPVPNALETNEMKINAKKVIGCDMTIRLCGTLEIHDSPKMKCPSDPPEHDYSYSDNTLRRTI